MMKYLLVEDERFAYEEMKRMMETPPGRSDVAGYPVD